MPCELSPQPVSESVVKPVESTTGDDDDEDPERAGGRPVPVAVRRPRRERLRVPVLCDVRAGRRREEEEQEEAREEAQEGRQERREEVGKEARQEEGRSEEELAGTSEHPGKGGLRAAFLFLKGP